jgi:hypothetical protein
VTREGATRLRVEVGGEIDAGVDASLLAPAIRTLLAGGAWPAGPEQQVAEAVLGAVASEARDRGVPWP